MSMDNMYSLPDLDKVAHHPALEEISEIISKKTRREDLSFFRVVTAYYLAVVAACMRAKLITKDRGEIPVNAYTLALAPSGFGKGYSTFTLENEVLQGFRDTFRHHILPVRAESHMWALATRRAALNSTEEQLEYDLLEKELSNCGAYPFVFDGASEPAIKQIRQLLLIADSGSINFQVDEVGLNLEKSMEALRVYLELYDQGLVKDKLTKNSADNKRSVAIEGKTPANMLLFGTPSRLLDGGATERMFYSMLETGYARRCLFAWGQFQSMEEREMLDEHVEEIYNARVNPANDATLMKWANRLEQLADINKFNWGIELSDDIGKRLLYYQMFCEKRARSMPEHEEIRKAEMDHRYYKALKLAGVYAFIDESLDLTTDHLYAAIKLVEESGVAFQSLLSREAPYMKLARYLSTAGREVTHADLLEALPFYKGSAPARMEMMTMATAWGYRQHIMVRKNFVEGIEFFSGETLRETSLEKIKLSYSDDFAFGYQEEEVPFEQMNLLTQAEGMHWSNHAYTGGHRSDEDIIEGFNMVVLDVDGGVPLSTVHELMEDYVYMTYTTKRHTPDHNRFRLLLPINYELKLSKEDYREFMDNLSEWLPFVVLDNCGNQRSKKWLSNPHGTFHINTDGKILDALPFVPKTSKNERHKEQFTQLQSLDNLERWFAQRFAEGNRNNQMIKFALALVDVGMSYAEVESKVIAFNAKLSGKLSQEELRSTVLVTVAKRLQNAA